MRIKRNESSKLANLLKRDFNSSSLHFSHKKSASPLTELLNFVELINIWKEVVGEKLDAVTAPLKIKNRALYVLTDHPAWSQQLSFLEQTIRQKLYKKLPLLEKQIDKLCFQVNNQHFLERKKEITKLIKKSNSNNDDIFHPYDPKVIKLKEEAYELFKDISDPESRQILISLHLQLNYRKN